MVKKGRNNLLADLTEGPASLVMGPGLVKVGAGPMAGRFIKAGSEMVSVPGRGFPATRAVLADYLKALRNAGQEVQSQLIRGHGEGPNMEKLAGRGKAGEFAEWIKRHARMMVGGHG